MECLNCYSTSTPQWRKINNNIYCNACGCHYQRHGTHRNVAEVYAKILINLKNNKI